MVTKTKNKCGTRAEKTRKKFVKTMPTGVTLVELTMAMAISLLVFLAVGTLLVNGQKGWQQIYESAHKPIKQQAQFLMLSFGKVGRSANRNDYNLYTINGTTFTKAVPNPSSGQRVVFGDAVEFRYWDVELTSSPADTYDLMNKNKMATAYALYYVQSGSLKVDYYRRGDGTAAVKAVNASGVRNTSNIVTHTIANRVTKKDARGIFTHTTFNGTNGGCVKINLVLTDPNDSETINVRTATFMRNVWPR